MIVLFACVCALVVYVLFFPLLKAGKYKDFNRGLGNFRN